MEPDRFKNHNKLYILGILCLIAALSLFFFSLYIVPFLIWHLNYEVPTFVTVLTTYFEQQYNWSEVKANLFVWLIFFIPSLITGYIAYYVSNSIDNQIYHIGTSEGDKAAVTHHVTEDMKESAGLAFKIILIIFAIISMILLLQLLVLT